ncbi:MAG: hypothetical protein KDC34_16145 [Saprospiraceae bacterium]|nr:hypothetical protein [Saprospiraceae bacterium]
MGGTTAALDQQAAGGVIADGFIQFPNEDGTVFTATFEATSHLTKGEVVYKIQKVLLHWDSAAFAFLCSTLLFVTAILRGWLSIEALGNWGIFASLSASLLLFFFFFRATLKWIQRYFYIYAIEQFKQYHANEQWISIGDDVFVKPDSKYLRELKRQCVKNGVGLIKIQPDEHAILIITPARKEVFSKNRRFVEFVSQSKILANPTQRIADQSKRLWQLTGAKLSTDRFQRNYYNQMGVVGICTALIVGLIYIEWQKAKVVYIDGQELVELRDSIRLSGSAEPAFFEVDSAFLKTPFPIADLPSPVYENKKQGKTKENVPDLEEEPAPYKADVVAILPSGDTIVSIYDCSRLLNLDGIKYLIVEGNYGEMAIAEKQLKLFSGKGLSSGIMWMGCFSDSRYDYALFFGSIYNTLSEAVDDKKRFEMIRSSGKANVTPLTIVTLNNK